MTLDTELKTFEGHFPPDPKKRKILHDVDGNIDGVQAIMAATLVVAIIFFTYLLWLSFFEDNPPITVNNIELITATAPQGEQVSFIFDFCKHTTSPVDLRRSWVNGTIRNIVSENPPSRVPGCYKALIAVDVPLDLLPGEGYHILSTFTFDVNHFATYTVEEAIGPFTITEALNG